MFCEHVMLEHSKFKKLAAGYKKMASGPRSSAVRGRDEDGMEVMATTTMMTVMDRMTSAAEGQESRLLHL